MDTNARAANSSYPPPCGEGRPPSGAKAVGVGIALSVAAIAHATTSTPTPLASSLRSMLATLPTRGRVEQAERESRPAITELIAQLPASEEWFRGARAA